VYQIGEKRTLMDALGINLPYFLFQFCWLAILLAWIAAAVTALVQLRSRSLDDTARVIWAVFIVLMPIGGAVAFWIVQPGKPADS
jgi:hypothetical protein